jgi:hypothetical protein
MTRLDLLKAVWSDRSWYVIAVGINFLNLDPWIFYAALCEIFPSIKLLMPWDGAWYVMKTFEISAELAAGP